MATMFGASRYVHSATECFVNVSGLTTVVVAPTILGLGTSWIPESPRWLISRHHTEKALSVLSDLHRQPGDDSNSVARRECASIEMQLEMDASRPQGLLATLKEPSYRKRFFMGVFVQ
jgi:hypothetical protein